MSKMNAADVANKLEEKRAEHGGGSMAARGGSTEFKSTWNPEVGPEQALSSSGGFDPSSSYAQQYNSLEEDGSSRVDDEAGWRELQRDNPIKSAAEYEALVNEWSKNGFDVKVIDMKSKDGKEDFTHSNVAIKPKGETGDKKPESGGLQSPEMSEAKAYTRAMFDYRQSGDDAQSITGYNPVTGEYGFNKSNGETAASQFNKRYKAQLKYELNLKPESLVFKGGKDDQQDGEAVNPDN
jgi:hypothetical protein